MKIFASQSLATKYGTNVLVFDEPNLPRDRIPQKYHNLDQRFTVKYQDTAIVGTLSEHSEAERQLMGLDAKQETIGTTDYATYVGPQYVYQTASGASNNTVSERTGPINVALNKDLNKLSSKIKVT
jgi:hypothetical protein